MLDWYTWPPVLWAIHCFRENWKKPQFRERIQNIPDLILELLEALVYLVLIIVWPWKNSSNELEDTKSRKVIRLSSRRTKITQDERPPPPDEGA